MRVRVLGRSCAGISGSRARSWRSSARSVATRPSRSTTRTGRHRCRRRRRSRWQIARPDRRIARRLIQPALDRPAPPCPQRQQTLPGSGRQHPIVRPKRRPPQQLLHFGRRTSTTHPQDGLPRGLLQPGQECTAESTSRRATRKPLCARVRLCCRPALHGRLPPCRLALRCLWQAKGGAASAPTASWRGRPPIPRPNVGSPSARRSRFLGAEPVLACP
mmetsp:Transcript_87323/g.250225  ORF Transcript_87323/g.250225 Transcript_87323/m.250225 type:complete len:218 (-) Transcript_87323:109-762(-)